MNSDKCGQVYDLDLSKDTNLIAKNNGDDHLRKKIYPFEKVDPQPCQATDTQQMRMSKNVTKYSALFFTYKVTTSKKSCYILKHANLTYWMHHQTFFHQINLFLYTRDLKFVATNSVTTIWLPTVHIRHLTGIGVLVPLLKKSLPTFRGYHSQN